jgi:hypothetical protein
MVNRSKRMETISHRTKMFNSSFAMILLLASLSACQNSAQEQQAPAMKTVYVYILAGQSNMDGLGLVAELPDEYKKPIEGVFIYNPNRKNDQEAIEDDGFWSSLMPGHGSGYGFDSSGSKYSDKFGVELSFVKTLKELHPDEAIAIFKYAKGGASIHPDAAGSYGSWTPDFELGNGINQWDHFEHHYKRAMNLTDIDGDGTPEILKPAGILWLQGESDAVFTEAIARQYEDNIRNLITRMRALSNDASLPVVIARISESMQGPNGVLLTYGDIVRDAQASFAQKDSNVSFIDAPAGHGWSDPWHYDSKTYLDLGVLFAQGISELKAKTEK